jgi:hypothetical protein
MRNGTLCVIGIDPGGSTGWTTYNADIVFNDAEGKWEFFYERWNQGQFGPDAHHLALWNHLGYCHSRNYVIVCESFDYRWEQREDLELVSREYIGVVNLYAQERNHTLPADLQVQVVMQTAAVGKGFWYPKVKGKKATWDDSKLKALCLYHPTTNGRHINDSTAHLLQWLTFGPFDRRDFLLPLKDIL